MKITKQTINSIPSLIRDRKLTTQDALNLLAVEFLKNPRLFLEEYPEEELKSELILKILQKGTFVLERYKEGYGIFSAYFTSFVRFQYKTILRQKKAQKLSEATYVFLQKTDYEAKLDLYENQEYYRKNVAYSPITSPKQNESNEYKDFLDKNDISLKNLKKTILILTMKYINYINLDLLDEIAIFCDYPQERLRTISINLLKILNKKRSNREILEEKRDKAFFLKRKYQLEIDFLKANNLNYLQKEYLLQRQTKFWNDKMEQLRKKTSLITPTNKEIAEQLNLKERIISYYIKNATKYIN